MVGWFPVNASLPYPTPIMILSLYLVCIQVDMNGRMVPSRTQWMKLSDSGGMVLEEQPAKLAEAIRLYLQGQGYGQYYTPPQTRLIPPPSIVIHPMTSCILQTSDCFLSFHLLKTN